MKKQKCLFFLVTSVVFFSLFSPALAEFRPVETQIDHKEHRVIIKNISEFPLTITYAAVGYSANPTNVELSPERIQRILVRRDQGPKPYSYPKLTVAMKDFNLEKKPVEFWINTDNHYNSAISEVRDINDVNKNTVFYDASINITSKVLGEGSPPPYMK